MLHYTHFACLVYIYLSLTLTDTQTVSFQPIPEWTTSNVAEWITSVNLHRYRDIFKSQGMKGCDLLQLNSEKLKVNVLSQINNCNRKELYWLWFLHFSFLSFYIGMLKIDDSVKRTTIHEGNIISF